MFAAPFDPVATAIAACLQALGEGSAIQIFPAGTFDAPRGAMAGSGPWRMDAEIARRVIERFAARRGDVVIDYEHQTLRSARNGQPAPAAGWLSPGSLEWRPDGLYALEPRWTEKAAAAIAAGEYRYLSPVFRYDPKTGEVLELLHLAITNNPAIDGMAELAAASANLFDRPQEPSMNEELLKALGLEPGATEEEAVAALGALNARLAELESRLESAETAAASAAAPDPAKYVPVEAVTDLQSQVAALSAQIQAREVDELVTGALEQGKLTPALESWARELGAKDMAALKSYLDDAAPIAALTGIQTGGREPSEDAARLTEEERWAAAQLGIPEAEFAAAKQA